MPGRKFASLLLALGILALAPRDAVALDSFFRLSGGPGLSGTIGGDATPGFDLGAGAKLRLALGFELQPGVELELGFAAQQIWELRPGVQDVPPAPPAGEPATATSSDTQRSLGGSLGLRAYPWRNGFGFGLDLALQRVSWGFGDASVPSTDEGVLLAGPLFTFLKDWEYGQGLSMGLGMEHGILVGSWEGERWLVQVVSLFGSLRFG